MEPLAPRIMSYLDKNASQWVPYQLLYSLASSKDYTHHEITTALATIEHTPPYAVWSVSAGDYHAQKEPGITGKGKYYRRYHMDMAHATRAQESLDAFDAL
jgi:hypothetical protein